ncbi:MAG: site-specific DNA-methyltransferase [Candidatus Woesearchaeota archaeon]
MRAKDYSTWTKEELIKELEKFKKQKKYGIVWEDKPEQVALMCKEKLPVLTEVKDKEIITDPNKPTNILIEGDNYHALSVLNYTHKGKIDVIYIDPPYNTGNEGFMYNDKIVDKEDAYRHSKWLSFMEKRLRLARNLLSDKGVIFISIDDNEVAQLKLLCDEIFGEENCIGIFVWRKKAGAGADSKLLFTQHEYILFYSKNIKNLDRFFEPLTEKQKSEYKNPDNDPRGLWAPTDLTAPSSDTDNSRLYEVVSPTGKKWLRRWSYTKENMRKLIEQNLVWFGKDGNAMPKRKRFLSEKQGLVPRSWIDFVLTSDGKKDFEDIFGKDNRLFEYPKPTLLIKHLIRIPSKKNSIILDFFAGSGTTGHAVLELNKEDGGNRKFILCTNNENNICTDVCYPRIEKVIKGYKNLKGEKVEGLGGNLKYFKTDFVDAKPTDKNKKKLVDESTEMLCLKEDCFDFVLEGRNFKIFKNNEDKYLGIIYDDDGIEPFKKEAKKLNKKFIVYVFSLDDSAREEEFEDLENVELKPIPAVILNVYKRIFRGL